MPSVRRDEGHRFSALLRGDLGTETSEEKAKDATDLRKQGDPRDSELEPARRVAANAGSRP